MSRFLKVHGALLLVTLIYSGNYTVAKIAMPDYIMPFGFIALRVTVGTILFWAFSQITGTEKIAKSDFGLLFLCGLFGVAMNQMLFFSGLNLTNPINGSIIMSTSPIIVMLTAYLMGREGITIKKIAGVIVGATGAYLLLTKDGVSFEGGTFLGDLFILINGASYAVYLVIVKPLMAKYKASTVIKWIFFFGMCIVWPFGFEQFSAIDWNFPVYVWVSIAYVLLAATFLVYILNVWSLKFVNSSVVGIYIYLQPVFATLIAISFRGDKLDILTIIYSFLIMGGVYLVSKK